MFHNIKYLLFALKYVVTTYNKRMRNLKCDELFVITVKDVPKLCNNKIYKLLLVLVRMK